MLVSGPLGCGMHTLGARTAMSLISTPGGSESRSRSSHFEQRQRHRMVVHVDGCGMDVGRDRRPPVDGVFAGFQFLDVVPVELRVRRASTPGATGFLLDGTFPWALLSHATLGSCQRSSDDFAQFAAPTTKPTKENAK
jgi:hypothetical protein